MSCRVTEVEVAVEVAVVVEVAVAGTFPYRDFNFFDDVALVLVDLCVSATE
jgi:hypothetical protein